MLTFAYGLQVMIDRETDEVFEGVVVDKFYVDGGCVWLRIFDEKYDDDRNNVLDLEGMPIDDAIELIKSWGCYDDLSENYDLMRDVLGVTIKRVLELI